MICAAKVQIKNDISKFLRLKTSLFVKNRRTYTLFLFQLEILLNMSISFPPIVIF